MIVTRLACVRRSFAMVLVGLALPVASLAASLAIAACSGTSASSGTNGTSGDAPEVVDAGADAEVVVSNGDDAASRSPDAAHGDDAGVDASSDAGACVAITAGSFVFTDFFGGKPVWGAPFTPLLGPGEKDSVLVGWPSQGTPAPGTYTLGGAAGPIAFALAGVSLSTTRNFLAVSGTLLVSQVDATSQRLQGDLSAVRLVEVDPSTKPPTPIANGTCLTLAHATINVPAKP
jgi:hypothetical protein